MFLNVTQINSYREASNNFPQYWGQEKTEEPEEGWEDEDDDLDRIWGDGDGEQGCWGPVGSQGTANKAEQCHGEL